MTELSDGVTDARIQAGKVIAGIFTVCKSLRRSDKREDPKRSQGISGG